MADALEDLKVIGLHMHATSKALNRAIREIGRLRAREATVREEALEEAAKIADDWLSFDGVEKTKFHDIAAAIRALAKEKEAE